MSFMLLGILNSQVSGGGAPAFDLLETTTLASDTTSITFSSLGSYSDYKHLQIRGTLKTSDGSVGRPGIRFNGVTASGNYKAHRLRGNGSNVASETDGNTNEIRLDKVTGMEVTANEFTPVVWDILDFSNSSKYTTVRSLHGYHGSNSDYHVQLGSGVFLSTAAITSITIGTSYGTNLKAGVRLSLYGIKG